MPYKIISADMNHATILHGIVTAPSIRPLAVGFTLAGPAFGGFEIGSRFFSNGIH